MQCMRDIVTIWCVKAVNKKNWSLFDQAIGPSTGQIPPKKPRKLSPTTKIIQRLVWIY